MTLEKTKIDSSLQRRQNDSHALPSIQFGYGKLAGSTLEGQNGGYGNKVMQSMSYGYGGIQLKKDEQEESVQLKEEPAPGVLNANNTGLPDQLKSGIENLSGMSMSDVKVHYNSDKPAQMKAHACAQGTDIHVASGQEKHLPHEAWHVVQQKQGRVKPTMQMKAVNINDDAGLEKEADVMGQKALTAGQNRYTAIKTINAVPGHDAVQRKRALDAETTLTDFGQIARGDNAKYDDTVQVAENNYQKSLVSGRDKMNEAVKWFTNAPDKKPQIETEETHKNVFDRYKVYWFFDNDEVIICLARGYIITSGEDDENIFIENTAESGKVDGYNQGPFEDDQDYLYANSYNVKTGEFHASINYRNNDIEIAEGKNLPPALSNSEIIWFMQSFAKEVYKKEYPEAEGLSEITSISREQIGNTQTLDTIFMADENRIAYLKGKVKLDEPTEEAIAILGTPNGNSSLWMLIQHEKSGEVDIESLEFKSDNIIINYMRDTTQND
ncbi:MAG: DUF4157 domain-containing protein [Sporocytophaga sp.]|nr:DUF4157 domain-containing protein [Sporocytophaga sp.]